MRLTTRVLASGVFDIIHLGHLHYLERSKALGDELVVVVATDNTTRRRKHEPITPENMRLELVSALKPVDRASLGREGDDIFKIVEEIRPDVITIGYDQPFEPAQMEAELRARGLEVKVVRMPQLDHDLNGTRKIINKIIQFHDLDKRLAEVEKR